MKIWHILLWVLQVVLGGMFIMAGFMKATAPIAELGQQMNWALDIPPVLVRFIGVSEFLGGLGLILPAALRIKPVLTPYAGVGLAIIMLFAAIFHASRGEYPAIVFNLSLGIPAALIAWGRFRKVPVKPK